MADSIKITDYVTNVTSNRVYGEPYTQTRSGTAEQHGRMDVGTSEEEITVASDIGNLGTVKFVNHDDTNYVEVGVATGVYYTMVPAGESVRTYGPATTGTFYVKANTASCDLEYHFFEQ